MSRARSIFVCLSLLLIGCQDSDPYGNVELIRFKDVAPANQKVTEDLTQLKLRNLAGEEVQLSQFIGKKNIVLVITRGFTGSQEQVNGKSVGSLCLYCSTQTARLISNYSKFKDAQAEVIVVFPIVREEDSAQNQQFVIKVNDEIQRKGEFPFPLMLDPGLKVVDALGIRQDLSRPATYVLDKQGKVRYAYVGASLNDRPSVNAILDELKTINKSGS